MNNCIHGNCIGNVYTASMCQYHFFKQPKKFREDNTLIKNIGCRYVECPNPIIALNLCGGHYRQKRLGKSLIKLSNHVTFIERHIDKIVENNDECWSWNGYTFNDEGRYGSAAYKGISTGVHGSFYRELIGEIKPGMTIDHLCRNSLCVNPFHLEVILLRENVQRMHSYRRVKDEMTRLEDLLRNLGYDSKTGDKL